MSRDVNVNAIDCGHSSVNSFKTFKKEFTLIYYFTLC